MAIEGTERGNFKLVQNDRSDEMMTERGSGYINVYKRI